MPNQEIVNKLLIFVNLHQHAKNKTVSSICSGEIVCLKNPKSDGLTESILAYISGTRYRIFPNIGFVWEHSK